MFAWWVSLFCYGFTCKEKSIEDVVTLGPIAHATLVYLWNKLVNLFCFVLFCTNEIHRTRMLQIAFLVSFGKLSRRRSASGWFHGVWTCNAKVFEYWMIFSLKIKLNCSWKFWNNWNVPLVLLERSWWTRYNKIYLVRFGFKMWEILIFKWFFLLKVQVNSKKACFGRKNQLKTW